MKINEKTLYAFANSRPVDREGFLNKRGEVNKAFQKRWFVLKGNLLFYYEKRGSSEPLGMVILEGCRVELADYEDEKFCFTINFPNNRCYILSADNQDQMELWMKALTTAGYDYMRLMISELQRQLAELDASSSTSSHKNGGEEEEEGETSVARPPRRLNPFDKMKNNQDEGSSRMHQPTISTICLNNNDDYVELRQAPPPPSLNRDTVRNLTIRDDNELLIFDDNFGTDKDKDIDFNFLTMHEYFGKSWCELIKMKNEEKQKAEQPLIVL